MQPTPIKSLRRSESNVADVIAAGASADASADTPSLVLETETLMRKLVEQVREQEPRKLGVADSTVICSAEVDGFRYNLTCTPCAMSNVALSPREKEIARMVAKGLPDKAIAAVLEISRYTVGTHLRRMYAKAGVASRAAMVAKIMTGNLCK